MIVINYFQCLGYIINVNFHHHHYKLLFSEKFDSAVYQHVFVDTNFSVGKPIDFRQLVENWSKKDSQ